MSDGASSVFGSDIDGDGDLDIVGAARDGDDITWWENTAGDGSAWTEHSVPTTVTIGGVYSVFAADLDHDGDTDALSASTGDEIAWKENFRLWMTFVNEYKNRGGRVTAGSDSGYLFKVYGFGYIRELELLQEAGFHPLEVIRAATKHGAEELMAPKEQPIATYVNYAVHLDNVGGREISADIRVTSRDR